jgi:photosynthetic reaction center cytochrome c subunit
VAKVNCATCHNGAWKPLYGAAMVKGHPELLKVASAAAAAPAEAAAPGAGAAPAAAAPAAASAPK